MTRISERGPVITVRPAACEDAQAMGEVHLASWRTTYRGIGIDEFIDNQPVENRVALWTKVLCSAENQTFVYVAEADGQIVGFASGGAEREGDPEYKGELYAVYLLHEYQRQGIGRKLLDAIVGDLMRSGYETMLIWVLGVNPARFFYEASGGKAVRQRPYDFGGKTFDEIGYGWRLK
jgi:ribosomal protein S18 acetylase RimI-like enzyme